MTPLNRCGWWCSDGEIILGVRRRDWSRVSAVDNGGALITSFIKPYGGRRHAVKGRETTAVEL
jgi:hypothetical protein